MYSRSDKRRLAPLIHSHRLPRQPPTTHELPRRANVGRVYPRPIVPRNECIRNGRRRREEREGRGRRRRRLPRERVVEQVQQQARVCVLRADSSGYTYSWTGRYYTPLYAVALIASNLVCCKTWPHSVSAMTIA